MPRRARVLSATGIYHIVSRGTSKQIIFEDETDRLYYLSALTKVLKEEEATLLAWCLMNNHSHLLIRFAGESGTAMRRINVKYAEHFNHKYERSGHLFQDRYRSEPVETESYLLAVARYIHQNPERAGIIEDYKEYCWSSYAEYIGTPVYCEPGILLAAFGGRDAFCEYHETCVASFEEKMIDERPRFLTDDEARELAIKELGEDDFRGLLKANRLARNEGIRRLRRLGLGCRQIERLTGVSFGVVRRC